MISFFEQTPESLATLCTAHGLKPFVGKQLLEWVYLRGTTDLAAMTNIARDTREKLTGLLHFENGRIIRVQESSDGTTKLLLEWPRTSDAGATNDSALSASMSLDVVADSPLGGGARGRQTECVMIPTEDRKTACISSQLGCPVGCRFCASGIGGVEGNLTAGQIVEQVLRLGRIEGVERVTHVVFMGMGEPLANFANVTAAIRTLNAPWGPGGGISARRITVSTVGLPAAIRKLITFELPVTLALSLHAPNDALRRQLIPWAEYATIEELLKACQEYFESTGREITLEYLLLRDVNDRPEHARELAQVAQTLRANVNLIRYNEVKGMPFNRPTSDDVRRFQEILRHERVNTHIRASRGRDIAAACGQLRHESAPT